MTPTNHWKLGLFVVCSAVAFVAVGLFLGARSFSRVTVPYVSYFDESVEGLEVGSPVKFRGVSIGNVSEIVLADDKRHVEVTYALSVKALDSLGLSEAHARGKKATLQIPPGLRVQLVPSGITGVKFMQMDFFDEQTNPAQVLPFLVPENTIPATPSTMKNLEATVVSAVDQFPELAKQVVVVVKQVSALLSQFEGHDVGGQLSHTLTLLDHVLEQISAALGALDAGALYPAAPRTLGQLRATLASINEAVGQLGGGRGLIASLQRTSDAVGNTAQNATHVGPALDDALKDVQRAANSVQRLASALEQDPDMLVKGRAPRSAK